MSNVLKPVVLITINGVRFHLANDRTAANAVLTSFEFEDSDGTGKSEKSKKGKRDILKFTFRDYVPETGEFLSDSPLFRNGNVVRFQWGFEGTLELTPERTMKIVNLEPHYPENGEEMVTVVCHDLSRDMNTETRDVTRPKKKLQKNEDVTYSLREALEEVIEESGLIPAWKGLGGQPVDEMDKIRLNGFHQKKETNMQFIQRLASEYGFEVYVQNKIVFFKTKKAIFKKKAWGFIHRGQNAEFFEKQSKGKRVALMLDFRPKIDIEKAASAASSADISSKENKKIEEKSEETKEPVVPINRDMGLPSGPPRSPTGATAAPVAAKGARVKKVHMVPRSDVEAQVHAEAEQQQSNESAITADAETFGDPRLEAKLTVISSGRISNKWNGFVWYVQAVKHKIDANGYRCHLTLHAPPQIAASPNKNKANKPNQPAEAENSYSVAINRDTGLGSNLVNRVKDPKTGETKVVTTKLP